MKTLRRHTLPLGVLVASWHLVTSTASANPLSPRPGASEPLFASWVDTELPAPSGSYAIGTIAYEWTDASRPLGASPHAGDRRRLPAQLWYPAEPDAAATPAPYAPLSTDGNDVVTHARLWLPFAPEVRSAPLVLIVPGRGTARYAYTTIAESLASHGYVVAAVDLPQLGRASFADGAAIPPNRAFRPSSELMRGPYEEVDRFFEPATALGLRDLTFVLDRIGELAQEDPNGRFTGRIDMDRVGVFGHSLGGRVAGALAAADDRLRAYASMEGIAPRRARFDGLPVPALMLCSSGTLPYAIDNYQTLIDGRREVVYMVELETFGHNSVTDIPLTNPGTFGYDVDPREALEITAELLLAFFDEHLAGDGDFLGTSAGLDLVRVDEHAPR